MYEARGLGSGGHGAGYAPLGGVFGPRGSVSAQASTDPVLVGAGDIASCSRTGDEATANLLHNIVNEAPLTTTVFTTGDNAYESGTLSEYANCYDNYELTDGTPYDSSRPAWWGEFKALTKPSPGNHEYETAGASGYFDHFGAAAGERGKGYYSYDRGSWHVVVLNSNCTAVGGCEKGSPQEKWLRGDLAANDEKACTLAYFHHPRFSSSGIGNNSAMMPFWEALYDAGAEVVLNGHAHSYERFAPQTPGGQADPETGISEFVVGTGGRSQNAFGTNPVRPNSEARIEGADGVIKLTLHPAGYDWQFVTAPDGTIADPKGGSPGSAICHGAPSSADTTAPTVKSNNPSADETDVALTTNVTATFSEDMNGDTIKGKTFKLFKKGSTTKLGATVKYDASTDTATLDPTNSLESGVTYKAVVTTGAKDVAGNPLEQSHKWFFTTSN